MFHRTVCKELTSVKKDSGGMKTHGAPWTHNEAAVWRHHGRRYERLRQPSLSFILYTQID